MSNWFVLLITGILFIVAGIVALVNPFAATVTANMIVGWSCIILGIMQIFEGVRADDWGGRLWSLLLGVVALLLGIALIRNPLEGIVALTIVVGVLFLVSGIAKMVVGFRVHDKSLKWAVVLSGLLSVILAFMVLSNMPGSAVVTLGVLLAVELLSNGISATALAMARKSGGVAS